MFEPRTEKLPPTWVSVRGLLGADRLPSEAANLFALAIRTIKAIGGIVPGAPPWMAIECIVADWLSGAPKGDH